MRFVFWGFAKSAAEIAANYADPVLGNEAGLLGHFAFGESQGNNTCDSIDSGRCISLINASANVWSASDAPLSGGGDAQAPTAPTNVQGVAVSASQINLNWTASTDNVGVASYDVRRDGVAVGSSANTNFNDTGLAANTAYVYTLIANDAAGNKSAESAPVSATTDALPIESSSSSGGGGTIGLTIILVLLAGVPLVQSRRLFVARTVNSPNYLESDRQCSIATSRSLKR